MLNNETITQFDKINIYMYSKLVITSTLVIDQI